MQEKNLIPSIVVKLTQRLHFLTCHKNKFSDLLKNDKKKYLMTKILRGPKTQHAQLDDKLGVAFLR